MMDNSMSCMCSAKELVDILISGDIAMRGRYSGRLAGELFGSGCIAC